MSKTRSKSSSHFIFGKHAVLEALKNNRRNIKELYITTNCLKTVEPTGALQGYDYKIVDSHFLRQLLRSEDGVHQGIAVKTEKLGSSDLKDILASHRDEESHLVIALDHITDPHNFGAILRSASAFGFDTIITTKDNAAKDSPVVAKSSCGAVEHLDICYVSNLSQSIDALKSNNYWVIGLDGESKDSVDIVSQYKKLCLVLGSEGAGMRKLTKDSCDILVNIGINPRMESLNVSNAAAIAMYEASKTK